MRCERLPFTNQLWHRRRIHASCSMPLLVFLKTSLPSQTFIKFLPFPPLRQKDSTSCSGSPERVGPASPQPPCEQLLCVAFSPVQADARPPRSTCRDRWTLSLTTGCPSPQPRSGTPPTEVRTSRPRCPPGLPSLPSPPSPSVLSL